MQCVVVLVTPYPLYVVGFTLSLILIGFMIKHLAKRGVNATKRQVLILASHKHNSCSCLGNYFLTSRAGSSNWWTQLNLSTDFHPPESFSVLLTLSSDSSHEYILRLVVKTYPDPR